MVFVALGLLELLAETRNRIRQDVVHLGGSQTQ